VFTDKIAAYNFSPGGILFNDNTAERKWASELHVTYFFNAKEHDESFYISPLGYRDSPSFDTTIDLPLGAESPHCSLELHGRCIFDAGAIVYPEEALKAKVSGSVTLEGKVMPSGELRAVHVVQSDVQPREKRGVLTNAAVQNLSSWRVDTAPKEFLIRITYSYEIGNSSNVGTQADVQFKLPGQIIVRGKVDPL